MSRSGSTYHVQCLLNLDGQTTYTMAWLPEKLAKVGQRVELKGEDKVWSPSLWRVAETYGRAPTEFLMDRERDFLRHRDATDI